MKVGGRKKKKKPLRCGENQGGFGLMGVGCPILELNGIFFNSVTSLEGQCRLFSSSNPEHEIR